MTQPLPIASKLPTKTLVAGQLPTNTHVHTVPHFNRYIWPCSIIIGYHTHTVLQLLFMGHSYNNIRTVRSIGGGVAHDDRCLLIPGWGMQHDKATISKNNTQWVNQYSNNAPTMGPRPLHQKLTNAQINHESAHPLNDSKTYVPPSSNWISKLEINRDWKLIAKNLHMKYASTHALRSNRS